MTLRIPESTERLIRNVPVQDRHPGLLLDKYVDAGMSGSEKDKRSNLEHVIDASSSPAASFSFASQGRRRFLDAVAAEGGRFKAKTSGPLAPHLSRSSALENAGIALHPIHGFAYLPGSGLKGMARAYAEIVWLSEQTDPIDAWQTIERVFGWAPKSDAEKRWKPENVAPPKEKQDDASIGEIIFHDAWPTSWPKLQLDIINNHHRKYYGEAATGSKDPPGDWENPNLVNFLCVPPDTEFEFAIGRRRDDTDQKSVTLATEWLKGALVHEGAGAKTAAGYGRFAISDAPPLKDNSRRSVFATEVELATPAFLAGATQKQLVSENQPTEEDIECDLRPATLRGLLRWWWRTMHVGYVDVPTLRAMEAAIWGSTERAAAVRVTVERMKKSPPAPFRPSEIVRQSGLMPPDDERNKTTQGIQYISYGMEEEGYNRYYLGPQSSWRISIVAAPSLRPETKNKSSDRLLPSTNDTSLLIDQAKAALWLLTHFGGVGAKSRKGFGSLESTGLKDWNLSKCKMVASLFREKVGAGKSSYKSEWVQSASIDAIIGPFEVQSPWKDPFFALDQLGYSVQDFAQRRKHQAIKKALGLPRRVQSNNDRFKPGVHVKENDRHSSPVHFHLSPTPNGFVIRSVAFIASELPDFESSTLFLQDFMDELKTGLTERTTSPELAHRGGKSVPVKDTPDPNTVHDCRLVAKRNKKGNWKAEIIDMPQYVLTIIDKENVPADARVGDVHKMKLVSVDAGLKIKWDTTPPKKVVKSK